MSDVLTTGQAARAIGRREYHLRYLLRQGLVTPSHRVAGRWLWTPADLEAARAALARLRRWPQRATA